MPFIQRVVQPVNLAQACSITSASGGTRTRFLCIPGKCQNQNCINNKPAQLQQQQQRDSSLPRELNVNNNNNNNKNINNNVKDKDTNATTSILKSPTASTATTTSTNSSSSTTTVTTAIIHTNGLKDTANKDTTDHHHQQLLNGFTNSFAYNTDHEDEGCSSHIITPVSPAPVMPMKKLKQHVEFLSTVPSPTRSQQHGSSLARPTQISSGSSSAPNSTAGTAANSRSSSHSRLRSPAAQTPQSPIGAKIVAGYEFDSISNITLSNALRQLASLVLIASDIFDDLQRELQSVGERARGVQKKIMAVEQRVSAYDPKMVTVPESDLLTFAQRKQHYESDKSHRQELFTSDTRPCSLRVLYDEAGKILPPPSTSTNTTPASLSAAGSPTMGTSGSMAFTSIDGMDPMDDTYQLAAGSDDLLCITEFGQSKRKMRRRIDAEIEIRLPAAIEDLRKWTSSEALGDVTVTPDCMHHVDTSISTSVVIGDNGVLTPALSPSVLSADAVDALYSINCNSTIDTSQIPNDINKDVPLNHRLPSPEEQCKIIALRYPAEVISVDTSGKRFQRMCLARKSTTGVFTHMPDTNNLNEDVQTVSRRSRSRKARGKRRNTIAGIDQKEIQDAANGDATTNALASATGDGNGEQQLRRSDSKSKKFGRSKSSDILKKESVALPYDKGKHGANTTLTRLNSLKQWGKNRFKFMQRNTADHNSTLFTINSSGASNDLNTSGSSAHNSSTEKAEICSASGSASGSSAKTSSTAKCGEKCATDIDDECVVQELIAQRKSECRFSHERKPSYSSSEKSMSVSSSGHLRGKLHLNSVVSANVKLRDTSSLNRQRRINGLTGNKDDQPHSSSGNWSASSESGRASIGSEITLQPKSSASNTSLNASSTFHNGSSAPPSSMLSRRRFLNTSASSSVTGSEGTCTPDLQMASEHGYPGHLDDETSSAYSCDTEGYYTSFHMDSGLRTLKEEEINMSNFQIGGMSGIPMLNNGTLTNNNQLSYGSNSQQTLMGTAENEYELFGKGSTSTTTSSAGTVCTTLMAHNGAEQSSLNNSLASCGPEVPERISSLRNSSASCSTLERSISSSTIGSTLERTGTIKRNVNASLKLTCDGNLNDSKTNLTTPESQEDEFQYISTESIKNRAALPLPSSSAADMEYSESSDLEGVERIERIKQKTALNARRIPSMCIITPSTSDDENDRQSEQKQNHDEDDDDVLNKTLTEESFEGLVEADDEDKASSSAIKAYEQKLDNNLNHLKSTNSSKTVTSEKLKVVLPLMKTMPAELTVINDDKLYDMAGEYVYISADVSNNNKKSLAMPATATQQPSQQQPHYNIPKVPVSSSLGIYYSNNILKQRPAQATEYVSLNDLPKTYKKTHNNVMESLVGMQQQQQNGGSLSAEQSADSMQKTKTQQQQQQYTIANEKESANTAMYAEINEIRSEIAASVPLYTPPSSASSSPHVSPHKGARVRLNAQGKPIYDSDSLKRRKGAHTTFAPGPYVKTQQEQEENESYYKSLTQSSLTTNTPSTQAGATSESVNPAVKLLLLNKSQINPRKIANVRPIINTSSNSARQLLTSRPLPSTPQEELTAKDNMSYAGSTAAMLPPYFHPQSAGMHHHHQHQQQSAMTANNAMHSPSAKSTGSSSTGSTISASTTNSSSNTHSSGGTASISTSSSINNKDEDYQHFYKKSNDVVDSSTASLQPYYETLAQKPTGNTEPFQRNTPVYWTLQNRKPAKQPVAMNATTSRDDLYATPIKRSERQARANAVAQAQLQQQQQQQANSINGSNLSPSIQRNRVSQFMMTSTPIRGAAKDSQLPADNIPAKQPTSRMANWDDNSPERLNTCADRIGQSKTSLMDFKKLLLAKSAKTSTLPKKISAVELLKKTNQGNVTVSSSSNVSNNSTGSGSQLNSSMKLLDLSGSPKTFANRRMLRQGQFGSPSKTFAPKTKTVPAAYGRSNSVQRTDIMSTTIMEANSEEDHTNSSGSRNSSRNSSLGKADLLEKSNANTAVSSSQPLAENLINTESFNYKRNIFLQSEENNFMRNELRNSFNRSTTPAAAVAGSLTTSAAAKPELNKYIPSVGTVQPIIKSLNLNDSINSMTSSTSSASSSASAAANETAAQTTTSSMPALETAL